MGYLAHYITTIIHIDSINEILDCFGKILQGLGTFHLSQNILIGNMTLICLCISISVLDFCLEHNHNTTQYLIKFLVCQFLRAHQTRYLQIFFVITTILILFKYKNIQHTLICQLRNIQQHPPTWKGGPYCYHRTWSE